MASIPIGPGSGLVTHPASFAPMPAVARVLAGFQRDQLASFIEVAIGLLDLATPDPDLEDGTDLEDDFALSPQAIGYATGPGCEVGDTGENAWVEWDKMRGAQKAGHNMTAGEEDSEEDDPSGQCDEDGITTDFGMAKASTAGCIISDSDFCTAGDDGVYSGSTAGCNHVTDDGPGDADDAEREQMLDDVPMLPVVALDHNIFTDQRQPLGLSNLQSSFRCGGEGIRSADSGALFVPRRDNHDLRAKPGVPV